MVIIFIGTIGDLINSVIIRPFYRVGRAIARIHADSGLASGKAGIT
jgi:hypothetical protein